MLFRSLGSRLGPRLPSVSLVRSSQLQWQQMAGSNVLYLGPPRFFRDRLGSLPVSLRITEAPGAFKNEDPRPGEQELYAYRDTAAYFSEDGEAYVLVSRAAGPSGNSDILTFASMGCHPLSVLTAFTVQDTAGVEAMQPLDGEWVADQARCLLEDMPVDALKVGVLGSVDVALIPGQGVLDSAWLVGNGVLAAVLGRLALARG